MAKLITTKIGDIFCVKLSDTVKGYFQYVANDPIQLNSSVIRAFYTHYSLDANPTMEDTVSDQVAFYAHTVLRAGIQSGVWQKAGKSEEMGKEHLHEVLFGNTYHEVLIK